MTSKEKQLLLKDLCARLPYGVMVHWNGENELVKVYAIKLYGYIDDCIINGLGQPEPGYEFDMRLNDILPYLRPMSSITEKENEELGNCVTIYEMMDIMLSHHLDCHELIPKHLALEAPAEMYKTE